MPVVTMKKMKTAGMPDTSPTRVSHTKDNNDIPDMEEYLSMQSSAIGGCKLGDLVMLWLRTTIRKLLGKSVQ